jgi:hypothetical protein
MAGESIINTDIFIRDRGCIRFFGSEILRKLIFCSQGWGICVSISPKDGDFVALFGPHDGAFATFFRQNDKCPTNARGEGVGHIEIINNTRGGIVILIQFKKGNAAIGGQIQVPDVYSCSHW